MDPATPGQYGGYQPPPPAGGGGSAIAMAKVSGPAIGLIVTAAVGIVVQILGILWKLVMGMAMSQMDDMPAIARFFNGPFGIFLGLFSILVGVLILFAAIKMRKLESYGLAMTGTILAMVPCFSPCCIIGLPIGIWALVVLLNQDVKAAFRS